MEVEYSFMGNYSDIYYNYITASLLMVLGTDFKRVAILLFSIYCLDLTSLSVYIPASNCCYLRKWWHIPDSKQKHLMILNWLIVNHFVLQFLIQYMFHHYISLLNTVIFTWTINWNVHLFIWRIYWFTFVPWMSMEYIITPHLREENKSYILNTAKNNFPKMHYVNYKIISTNFTLNIILIYYL